MTGKTSIRIGCASGFWGDTPHGARQLVERGAIDYLVFDYLAEITLALLARIRAKKPDLGYVPDFVDGLSPLLPEIMKRGIRVVSNGGGMNPEAAAAELSKRAQALGLTPKIAVVTGDDLIPRMDEFRSAGITEMFTGEPLPERLTSANAYLGAGPIARALALGADIVVTGRCVDSAVTLGALMHEFSWNRTEYSLLSAGSLAGHLLECGAQATGGLFTDWADVPGWDDMGFPIAECHPDGAFVITKPPLTGGLISPLSVGEQMLYEIGDPTRYLLPDVACDFSAVTMVQDGPDRVRVQGAQGSAPTGTLKVSATYPQGFRTIGTVTIAGRDAAPKAKRAGEAILKRASRIILEAGLGAFTETSIEVLGAEATYGASARIEATRSREVVLKIAARHPSEAALGMLAREIAPAATAMAQGLTGFYAGRPGVQPVMKGYSFLVPAEAVPATLTLGDHTEVIVSPQGDGTASAAASPAAAIPQPAATGPFAPVPLIALAVGRSGDKGNSANIGIIARKPVYLQHIKAALTPEAVASFFRHTGVTRVERFDLPGMHALNFVLHDCLGGGGVASLRIDPQGKAFAQMLMDMPIPVPAEIVAGLTKGTRPS
jgi:hypothetical protein